MSHEETNTRAQANTTKPEKTQLWADIDHHETQEPHSPYPSTQSTSRPASRPSTNSHRSHQRPYNFDDSRQESRPAWGRSPHHSGPRPQRPFHAEGRAKDDSVHQRHRNTASDKPHHHRPQQPERQQDVHNGHNPDLLRNQPAIMSEFAARKAQEIRLRNAREEQERRLNCQRLLEKLDGSKAAPGNSEPARSAQQDEPGRTEPANPAIEAEAESAKAAPKNPAASQSQIRTVEFTVAVRAPVRKPATPPTAKPIDPAVREIVFQVPVRVQPEQQMWRPKQKQKR